MESSLFNIYYTLRRKDATENEKFLARIALFDWRTNRLVQQEKRQLHEQAKAIYARSGLHDR